MRYIHRQPNALEMSFLLSQISIFIAFSRSLLPSFIEQRPQYQTRCKALQRTAAHCNTRQHTATHYNTLQHSISLRYSPSDNTLQQSTLPISQYTATHYNTLQHTATKHIAYFAIHCNTLQHAATHCNNAHCLFRNTTRIQMGRVTDMCV